MIILQFSRVDGGHPICIYILRNLHACVAQQVSTAVVRVRFLRTVVPSLSFSVILFRSCFIRVIVRPSTGHLQSIMTDAAGDPHRRIYLARYILSSRRDRCRNAKFLRPRVPGIRSRARRQEPRRTLL